MNYEETLRYLYEQLPMFQRIGPAAFKKDLSNTLKLCEQLGNPHQQFKSIHIAGTNGKGSVSHILAAVLQAAGYKTGLYISPHYKDFRERIKINGQYVSQEFVVDFVAQHKDFLGELQPSFFEITVVMAFAYFAKEKVDIAVIETGLGGRLDSTNVVTPELSVITNIGYDHMEFLGNTLPLIAEEKAGIIKPTVPVVIGEFQEETAPVFKRVAEQRKAPIQFAEEILQLQLHDGLAQFDVIDGKGNIQYQDLSTDLKGSYQQKNIRTSLAALEALKGKGQFTYQEEELRYGLAHIRELSNFMGRWQQIGSSPTIICDSAHNEHGVREMLKDLSQLTYDRLHIVWGSVKDKDHSAVLEQLPNTAQYYFCKPDIPRGLEAEQLKEKAKAFGLKGNAYPSVNKALDNAKAAASTNDLIMVSGSIFVVAEAL